MLLVWFLLVALMLTAYVVLDGFDIGVGILHLFLARSEEERLLLLRTIGPVWDGNEVWLIAGGGTLYFAFPLLYASAFSGFYLPLMMVLWLLIGRGIGIELRMHLDSPIWAGLFNGAFGIASFLLAIMFGCALANVLRGVPLQPDNFFFLPLWTDFLPGPQPGILDWYTVIGGVLATLALSIHGANYAALKTAGDINARSRRIAARLVPVLIVSTLASLAATLYVRPTLLENYHRMPILYAIPALVVLSLAGMMYFYRIAHEFGAFACSSVYLMAMMSGAAAAVYPNLLFSTTDPRLNITVFNARSGDYALSIGLIWWTLGMALAIAYFVFVYRMFRGKIPPGFGEHGH